MPTRSEIEEILKWWQRRLPPEVEPASLSGIVFMLENLTGLSLDQAAIEIENIQAEAADKVVQLRRLEVKVATLRDLDVVKLREALDNL